MWVMKGILVVICTISLLQIASALNVGVSPASINFEDVLRNGYAERTIIVTIDSDEGTSIVIEPRGDIAGWLNYSEEDLTVSKGDPLQLVVSVSPPSDVPNGNYTGFIRVTNNQKGSAEEGKATSVVIPTLDIFVNVEVTDIEVFSCEASYFNVNNVEESDDLLFTVDVKNDGNVRINPVLSIDIWNQELTEIVRQETLVLPEVVPTKEESLNASISSSNLGIGQYWADVSVIDCYATETLTFDILEEGALLASGILEGILVDPIVSKDDIVPVSVSFRNTGEKNLKARFFGSILYKDKIIQLLESDEDVSVPLGEQSNFQFYFTPEREGEYVISGRVHYDNKRTYEQSALVTVVSQGFFSSITKNIIPIILVVAIVVLIFQIRKERKSYMGKLRRYRR